MGVEVDFPIVELDEQGKQEIHIKFKMGQLFIESLINYAVNL
jgi:hypothetical protein